MAADDQSDRSFARPRGPIPIRPAPPRPTSTQIADAIFALVPAVKQLDSEMVELLAQSHALDSLFRRNLAVLERQEATLEEHRNLLERYGAFAARLEARLNDVRQKLDSQHDEVEQAAKDGARAGVEQALDERTIPGIGPEELGNARISRTPSDPAMAARKVGLGVVILAMSGVWSTLRFAWRGTKHVLGPIVGMLIVAWLVNLAYQHHWIKVPPEQILSPENAQHAK